MITIAVLPTTPIARAGGINVREFSWNPRPQIHSGKVAHPNLRSLSEIRKVE